MATIINGWKVSTQFETPHHGSALQHDQNYYRGRCEKDGARILTRALYHDSKQAFARACAIARADGSEPADANVPQGSDPDLDAVMLAVANLLANVKFYEIGGDRFISPVHVNALREAYNQARANGKAK
jgi:hypothetical protein